MAKYFEAANGRMKAFGSEGIYNPFSNASDYKGFEDLVFMIGVKAYAEKNVSIVAAGIVPGRASFMSKDFLAKVIDDDGSVIKILTPTLGIINSGVYPNEEEIFWFDAEGISGSFYVNSVYAGKALMISGKFEGSALTADKLYDRIGTVSWFGGKLEKIPSRALVCAGQEINRHLFSNLFEIIGTNFGIGNNLDTFNLPDLRDALPKGVQFANGVIPVFNDPDNTSRFNDKGGNAGSEVGSCQRFATKTATKEHNHTTTLNIAAYGGREYRPISKDISDTGRLTQFVSSNTAVDLSTGQSTRDNNVYGHFIIWFA